MKRGCVRGTVSPRAVPETRQLPGFCIAESEALRCTLAQSNEPGSGNKVIVAVKWNGHYALGNGSSLEITCFLIELRNVFILSQVAYYLWVQCVIIKITYLGKNNEQKVSWKNTTQRAYIFLERQSSIWSTIVLCFTVVNPHSKQQNASDVSARTKRPCLKAQPPGTHHEAPHLWAPHTHLFTDLSQPVLEQRCWWVEWPRKLHLLPQLWSFHPQQSIFSLVYKRSSKNCSQFPSAPQSSEHRHRHYWQLGGEEECAAFIHF